MEIIGDLGTVNNNIVITKKYEKRDPRKTDGRDGMIAIGAEGNFDMYIPDTNNQWKWKFHINNPTEYAVDHSEIRRNITGGNAQIFISNIYEIKNSCDFYPENAVILYLHATHATETKKHIELKERDGIYKDIRAKLNFEASDEDVKNIFDSKPEFQQKFEEQVKKIFASQVDTGEAQ